ncbi:MAG: Ribosomal RNA large subunit methyltransferase J [Steroidobacteraceae bacterium]|nr:Ribosomal RNA large subunit methyltransferase J [Steroidobacteraceae bacterium]
MKYRHAFHAGNFADVHKHVALLALLRAMQRKDKGLFFLDTHAGRGRYALGSGDARTSGEAQHGALAVLAAQRTARNADPTVAGAPELADYAGVVEAWRRRADARHDYPGSAVLAAELLRPQDRGIAVETQPAEFEALRRTLGRVARVTAEHGDGWLRLRALLPPAERRGLLLIDPPYEDTKGDFRAGAGAVHEALARFATGVIALWYPVKDARDTDLWLAALARGLHRPALAAELWIHPPDSRAGLNGSGLVVVNPPYQWAERCAAWQPALLRALGAESSGGTRVVSLAGENR